MEQEREKALSKQAVLQDAKKPGKTLSSITFQAVYTNDTYRAFHTARIMVEESSQPDVPIYQDMRLRE